jgi:hypothetical protein
MLDALRALPGVDRLQEAAVDAPHTRDDSSSAGLTDDVTRADFHDVEIRAVNSSATEDVRDSVELAARDAGVVVEWLNPF